MTRIFFYGVYVICLYIVNNFYIGNISYSQRLAQLFIKTPSALRRPAGEFTIITPQRAGLTGHRVTRGGGGEGQRDSWWSLWGLLV